MRRPLTFLRTVWRNRRQQTDLPRFLTYIVTFTCNARCIMCDSWRKPSPNDLTLDEIEGIFDQLPELDGVRLSGGEPFVRRDLLEIAHLAQEKLNPLFLHVTTNGFLTDRIVRFCEQRRKDVPLQLLISVDGLAEKHNRVRGHDKAWDYVTRTLEALAPRRRELRLQLAVNQTIVDAEGAEHYRKLRDHLRPLGVHNNFVMAYDASATYHLDDEVEVAPDEIGQFATFGEFSHQQLADLFDWVEHDLADYPLLERIAKRYYLRGIRSRLLEGRPKSPAAGRAFSGRPSSTDGLGHEVGPKARVHGALGSDGAPPSPPCVALNSHLRLLPDGRVPTCQFNTRVAGDLRQQSFEQLWHSEQVEKQRSWVRACPGCWAECEVLPNAVYTGDLVRDLLTPASRHRPPRPNSRRLPVLGSGGAT